MKPDGTSLPGLRPAVFLDRDGTLMEEVRYCRNPQMVRLLPGVLDGLSTLRAAAFRLVIVTNQSGLGRGWITPAEYEAVHLRLMELLGPNLIDATYLCPDHPDAPTPRRKPGPGMLLEAARDLQLDLPRSYLIGDRNSDVACARAAGAHGILVQTGYGALQEKSGSTFVARDFAEAVRHILHDAD